MTLGPIIRTGHGVFLFTQKCILTPLIPLYVAAGLAAPIGWRRRTAMLVATPLVFFALGVSRLLVLAVPAAVIGSYAVAIHAFSQTLVAVILVAVAAFRTAGTARRGAARAAAAVALGAVAAFAAAPIVGAVVGGAVGGLESFAGHAGHAFADDQGAWAILPAFQVGLFAALWIAVAGGGLAGSWRRALIGLAGIVLVQAAFGTRLSQTGGARDMLSTWDVTRPARRRSRRRQTPPPAADLELRSLAPRSGPPAPSAPRPDAGRSGRRHERSRHPHHGPAAPSDRRRDGRAVRWRHAGARSPRQGHPSSRPALRRSRPALRRPRWEARQVVGPLRLALMRAVTPADGRLTGARNFLTM